MHALLSPPVLRFPSAGVDVYCYLLAFCPGYANHMDTVTHMESRCLMLECQGRHPVRSFIGRASHPFVLLVGLIEGCVEGNGTAGEVQAADEAGCFCTSVDAVHADIFPLH